MPKILLGNNCLTDSVRKRLRRQTRQKNDVVELLNQRKSHQIDHVLQQECATNFVNKFRINR